MSRKNRARGKDKSVHFNLDESNVAENSNSILDHLQQKPMDEITPVIEAEAEAELKAIMDYEEQIHRDKEDLSKVDNKSLVIEFDSNQEVSDYNDETDETDDTGGDSDSEQNELEVGPDTTDNKSLETTVAGPETNDTESAKTEIELAEPDAVKTDETNLFETETEANETEPSEIKLSDTEPTETDTNETEPVESELTETAVADPETNETYNRFAARPPASRSSSFVRFIFSCATFFRGPPAASSRSLLASSAPSLPANRRLGNDIHGVFLCRGRLFCACAREPLDTTGPRLCQAPMPHSNTSFGRGR